MLLEQVSLQQSGTDEMLCERKPLLGMAQNGITYLMITTKNITFSHISVQQYIKICIFLAVTTLYEQVKLTVIIRSINVKKT